MTVSIMLLCIYCTAVVVTTMKSITPTNITSPSTATTATTETTATTSTSATTKEVTIETTKPTEATAVTPNATSIHGNNTGTEETVNAGEMVRVILCSSCCVLLVVFL